TLFRSWLEQRLRPGRWGLFAGKVSDYRSGGRTVRQLAHPSYELLDEPEEGVAQDYASEIIPIYPATREVSSWEITKAVRAALSMVELPPDPLPERLRSARGLVDLATALHDIHRPESWEALEAPGGRLSRPEAFALQLTQVQRTQRAAATPATRRPYRPGGLRDKFDADQPYELTAGQQAVGKQLERELGETYPMHRLLQGEVGS